MQYNPRTVLRQVPNFLLARFFSRFAGFAGFDWSRLRETEVESTYECWHRLPKAERDLVSSVFRQIHALANPGGTGTLVAAARDSGLDIRAQISAMQNAYERAFWCMLEHPDVFHNGRTLAHIDSIPQKSREKWTGLPHEPIAVTPEMLANLEGAIRDYYQQLDGRGEACHAEYRRREGAIDSFFAYPADYVNDVDEFDENGNPVCNRRWGRFEIAFALNSAAGTLEVSAEGGRQVRRDLCERFLRVVLNQNAAPQHAGSTPYDMDVFKNRQLSFPTDPADTISIRVQGLRLQVNGSPDDIIAVDAGSRSRKSAYAVLDAVVDQQRAPLETSTVMEAKLNAVVPVSIPRKRPRRITFTVSPFSCSLGDSPEEEKIKRYLRPWGIEHEQCA
jgi:hypothetical protein